MKKQSISALLIISLGLFSFFACESDSDSSSGTSDAKKIETAILKFQDALNNNSLEDFKNTVHPDSNYYSSYTQADLTAQSELGTVSFSGFKSTISGDTATTTCTNSFTNKDGVQFDKSDEFQMKKDSSTWKVLKWTDDGIDVYQKVIKK